MKIKILDFSGTPGARFKTDGPFSAEEFRDEHLIDIYQESRDANEVLVVDLDGGYGYAASFLEEAFGGLVRSTKDKDAPDHIEFICKDDPSLEDEIIRHMTNAVEHL